jgi:multidrug efflux system outer membrane protein
MDTRKMTGKAAILFSFLVISGIGAETRQMNLDEAVKLALANNSDLRKQRIALSVSETKAASSWNVFLPSVSLSGTVQNIHAFSGSSPTDGTGNSVSASAGLTLSLSAGTGETLKQATIEAETALLVYRQAEAALVKTVKKSYFSLLADKADIVLSEKNLALARSQEKLIERNYQNGLASELVYLRAQYAAASLEPALLQKVKKHSNAVRSFCFVLGIPLDSAIEQSDPIPDEFPALPRPDNFEMLIESRFDVLAALLYVKKTESQKTGAALNRYAPTVSLSETTNVSALQESFRAPETGTFRVSVEIPLNGYIPGSKTNVAAKENASAVEASRISLEQTRLGAKQEIRALMDTLEQLEESIRINRMSEKIAVRAYELSEQGYNAGLVTQIELDGARQSRIEAQQNMLMARTGYKAGLIDLAFALNISETELYMRGTEK